MFGGLLYVIKRRGGILLDAKEKKNDLISLGNVFIFLPRAAREDG
jgi:hypothetical protein